MTQKHTPTWVVCSGTLPQKTIIADDSPQAICTTHGDNYESNAHLIVAARNSYAAHCKDPIKAAENDLLGAAIAALRVMANYLPEDERACDTLMVKSILNQCKEV